MATIRIVSGSHASSQGPLPVRPAPREFFGGNFLFDRDGAAPDGTYARKADALGLGLLRFPGGTVAERHFSLADPDRTAAPGARGPLTPLSEFVALAEAKGLPWSLVVPVGALAREVLAGTRSLAEVRAEAADFFAALKAGAFGAHLPAVIELGNEHFALGFDPDVSRGAYAPVAVALAEEARAAFGRTVAIAAQACVDPEVNAIEAAAFRPGLVDAVIVHAYPPTLDRIESVAAARAALAAEWIEGGRAREIFLSEWNLAGSHAAADGRVLGFADQETGMSRAAALVEMAAAFLRIGVARAAVWPVQQNTPGDLGGDEGETAAGAPGLGVNDLTPAGEAFRLMAEALPGKRLLSSEDIDLDGAPEAPRFARELLVEAFGDRLSLVVFVSAWDLGPDEIGRSLGLSIDAPFRGATVSTLTAAGPDPLDPNARPIVETTEAPELRRASDLELSLDHAWSVTRFEFFKPPPQTLRGGAAAERLAGGAGDDAIRAAAGADLLAGRAGADTLRGGAGDDALRGGGGADDLAGAAGSDRLVGGPSDDLLSGGAGADTLIGGAGDDRLAGGPGADAFVFAGSSGADRIVDFAPGLDSLRLPGRAAGFGIEAAEEGSLIVHAGGTILLEGVFVAANADGDPLF